MRAKPLLFAPLLLVQAISSQSKLPDALHVPKGQVLLQHLTGKGKQIYTCETAHNLTTWKLQAPDAKLYGQNGTLAGRHFAGPTWEANDHSRVTGKVITSLPSPNEDAIPWLLLSAVSHDGLGIFSYVQSIQRLETKGGTAPTKTCKAGDHTDVPYEASYYFWGEPKK